MNAKLIEEEKAKEAAGESDLGRQPLEDVMKVGERRVRQCDHVQKV
jgi:hypothetical protein